MSQTDKFLAAILDGNDMTVIDVGAAYGLPPHLSVLERSSRVCLFEPDTTRAEELRRHYNEHRGLSNVTVFAEALAGEEGERTLYVTNVPTGSSLLRPGSPIVSEFGNQAYFFPLREQTIRTRKLANVLRKSSIDRADAIKLDAQGSELEILRGLGDMLAMTTLVVELEIGFPGAYLDQPGFGAVDEFMSGSGFRLYDLRVVRHHRGMDGDSQYYAGRIFGVSAESPSLSKRISEADALYFKRPEQLLQSGDAKSVRRLIALMCVYGQFIEAYDLAQRALLANLLTADEAITCKAAIEGWHRDSTDLLTDSKWYARFAATTSRIWKGLQRRALGKRFVRWQE